MLQRKLLPLPNTQQQQQNMESDDVHSIYTNIQLDLSKAQHDFNQGRNAYVNANYDQAITQYTQLIHHLQSSLSTAFLHRAAAYEKQNQHTLALKDSQAANPNNDGTCPDAFHAMANAYCIQGNLSEAIVTYRHAMTVVPLSHPERSRIDQKYNQLMQRVNERNQWWTCLLPNEVLLLAIIHRLSVKDRIQLSFTCRFWHQFIMQQWDSSLWYEVNIEENTFYHQRNIELIDRIPGHSVKKVILASKDESQKNDSYHHSYETLNKIAEIGWNQITSLAIGYFLKESLETILRLNCNSLQRLVWLTEDDGLQQNHRIRIISDAMNTCPNLNYLEYSERYSDHNNALSRTDSWYRSILFPDVTMALASASSNLSLSSLEINHSMKFESMVTLLQGSTIHLTSLTINSSKCADRIAAILDLVSNNHLPTLEELQFKRVQNYHINTAYFTRQHQQSSNGGIKKLTLELDPISTAIHNEIDQQLRLLFGKVNNTLEELKIDFGASCPSRNYESFYTLSQLDANNNMASPSHIRSLIIISTHPTGVSSDVLAAILRKNALSLEFIELEGIYFWQQRLFDALGSLTHLSTLRLRFQIHDKSILPTEQQIQRHLHRMVLNVHWFEPVFTSNRNTLREFSYGYCFHDVMKTDLGSTFVMDLIQLMRRCQLLLHTLDLGYLYLRQDTVIPVLQQLNHIKTLRTLAVCVADESVWMENDKVVDAFISIQSLGDLSINLLTNEFTMTTISMTDDDDDDLVLQPFLDRWNNDRFILIRIFHLDTFETHHYVSSWKHAGVEKK
ncbi:hypothetical protein BDA99DRAFT_527699 [Phascolomyces articulosus]|uniref:F-box domain-containing protein n=1 Tax=Phascolomyces articulosus TaxID=60185 RepID=A0AAD5P7P6_9FUNG|nr:hypothetical protein BDA99DRAFT_527699 [Phascolomyces articulosus]